MRAEILSDPSISKRSFLFGWCISTFNWVYTRPSLSESVMLDAHESLIKDALLLRSDAHKAWDTFNKDYRRV